MKTNYLLFINLVLTIRHSYLLSCYDCRYRCNYITPSVEVCDYPSTEQDSCMSVYRFFIDSDGISHEFVHRFCAHSLILYNYTELKKPDWELWEKVYCEHTAHTIHVLECRVRHCHKNLCNNLSIDVLKLPTDPYAEEAATDLAISTPVLTGKDNI